MWKTILVPHDFSGGAARAQALAGTLARKFDARVVLLHVTPLPPGMLPSTLIQPNDAVTQVTVSEFTTRAAAERLESWARPLRDEGVPVEVGALLGGIAETILDEAKRVSADVIVMGTHGRRGLAHLLLGSVAEKVVRQADVPVITVRSDAEAEAPDAPKINL
ncbi:universal stress protein [Myxococcota bacterium]|nr:universal stress protein [Myxococcota bacterium]